MLDERLSFTHFPSLFGSNTAFYASKVFSSCSCWLFLKKKCCGLVSLSVLCSEPSLAGRGRAGRCSALLSLPGSLFCARREVMHTFLSCCLSGLLCAHVGILRAVSEAFTEENQGMAECFCSGRCSAVLFGLIEVIRIRRGS